MPTITREPTSTQIYIYNEYGTDHFSVHIDIGTIECSLTYLWWALPTRERRHRCSSGLEDNTVSNQRKHLLQQKTVEG